MRFQTSLFLYILIVCTFESHGEIPLADQFKQTGYVEIYNNQQGTETFDFLYTQFDACIDFLQKNRTWAQKLYIAKERFLRSKERNYYSTDFFGFYDESEKEGRNQISFYYSIHFHRFICLHYPEFNQIPEFIHFLEMCDEIQKKYETVFMEAAAELNVDLIFSSSGGRPSILFKVIKYLPSYTVKRPHYDGTAFSLFLDSTDNSALLLSSYKSSFTVDDFYSPIRKFQRCNKENSILLIPGAFLTEFSIYPTPHIVISCGTVRYAAIAFAMRPHYISPKNEFSVLPNFTH